MTSPDSLDGLIARLRNYRWVTDFNPCPQAADAIERLRAERDAALVDAVQLDWSKARSLLMQGASIQQDHAVGNHKTYEDYMERIDMAAREVVAALAAEPKDGAATAEVKAFIEGLEK